jgi:S-adenosylmethionine:tRNA ribosyltransferase-isomerase
MKLSDFDFDLPEALIALRPVKPRPASRMLVARGDETQDCHVRDLPDWLRPGDILVFNDTKVIPARLFGERRRPSTDGSGVARIEVTLIHRDGHPDPPRRRCPLVRPGPPGQAADTGRPHPL